MVKNKMLLLGVLILLFTSCDVKHTIDYYVVNAYEEPIAISYKTFRGDITPLEIEAARQPFSVRQSNEIHL